MTTRLTRLLLLILLVFGFTTCKKERENKYSYFISAGNMETTDINVPPISYAEISLYSSEIDFFANKNIVKKGFVENGKYYIIKETQNPDYNTYWYRITFEKLNNLRYKDYKLLPNYQKYSSNENTNFNRSFTFSRISTTPVRLQLNVFENGKPVNNATVKIYLRNIDYVNDKRYNDTDFNIGNYLNYPEKYVKNDSYIANKYYDFLNKETNESGTVIFENYEPRQYWFRIEKNGKTNANSVFTTGEALPNDNNITTVLDVSIQ